MTLYGFSIFVSYFPYETHTVWAVKVWGRERGSSACLFFGNKNPSGLLHWVYGKVLLCGTLSPALPFMLLFLPLVLSFNSLSEKQDSCFHLPGREGIISTSSPFPFLACLSPCPAFKLCSLFKLPRSAWKPTCVFGSELFQISFFCLGILTAFFSPAEELNPHSSLSIFLSIQNIYKIFRISLGFIGSQNILEILNLPLGSKT